MDARSVAQVKEPFLHTGKLHVKTGRMWPTDLRFTRMLLCQRGSRAATSCRCKASRAQRYWSLQPGTVARGTTRSQNMFIDSERPTPTPSDAQHQQCLLVGDRPNQLRVVEAGLGVVQNSPQHCRALPVVNGMGLLTDLNVLGQKDQGALCGKLEGT
jgi:hypothetical protein